MPLLDRSGRIIADTWQTLSDDDVFFSGDIIVPLNRLPDRHNGRLGVMLANDSKSEDLESASQRASLITLNFPAFSDGRAYSQARFLREHFGFSGELRATGDLLPDQFAFMLEAGFDTFEFQSDRFPVERWAEVAEAITLTYHRSFSRPGQRPVVSARHLA